MGQTFQNYYTQIPNPDNKIWLPDLMVRRQAELAQLLGGCAALSPVAVLPMLRRLNLGDLQDEQARRYLSRLLEQLPALRDADELQCAEIVVQVAIDCDCAIDYLRWICLPDLPVEPVAESTIREIVGLVISRRAVEGLQEYARKVQDISHWGYYGNV